MTTGAIYGNFKNRDELFLALGQTYWARNRSAASCFTFDRSKLAVLAGRARQPLLN